MFRGYESLQYPYSILKRNRVQKVLGGWPRQPQQLPWDGDGIYDPHVAAGRQLASGADWVWPDAKQSGGIGEFWHMKNQGSGELVKTLKASLPKYGEWKVYESISKWGKAYNF